MNWPAARYAGEQQREATMGRLRWISPGRCLNMCAHDLNPIYAGETGFLLIRNPNTLRAPDAAFITRDRVVAAGKVSG